MSCLRRDSGKRIGAGKGSHNAALPLAPSEAGHADSSRLAVRPLWRAHASPCTAVGQRPAGRAPTHACSPRLRPPRPLITGRDSVSLFDCSFVGHLAQAASRTASGQQPAGRAPTCECPTRPRPPRTSRSACSAWRPCCAPRWPLPALHQTLPQGLETPRPERLQTATQRRRPCS